MSLSIGGEDITEFFNVLLERIKFPYRELDLNHSYDWNVMEDLKIRLCTLADVRRRLCSVVRDFSPNVD
jgi:actin-related protein 8